MWKSRYLEAPEGFNFRATVKSHGWYDLQPFHYDDSHCKLAYVFYDAGRGKAVNAQISEINGKLLIELDTSVSDESRIVDQFRHILRLDEPISDFYSLMAKRAQFAWVSQTGAGRLLRSPTVFEDLVKTLCTTNCSWSLTRSMVKKLVSELGVISKSGSRSFPSAETMAARDESFYRDTIRGGYRSPYFVELAESVAEGKIDPETWLDPEIPSEELRKQILSVKGCGQYAADNLMKLLGRYDGLALDSWLRAQFYKKHNRGKKCPDKKIERSYKEFGEWKGLAIWCDMTEDRHANN